MDLGRLERISLRSVWSNETSDFTPWLAREENLALLGDALGLELELQRTEQSVGPFYADIVCSDLTTDQVVLIENQLERTDHTHLGQVLTYAAGLDAVTIIWVAAAFTDEHRAALDWLNEVTTERASFFGLEVELWRIGGSPPAPKFNIVSKPNEWTRTARQTSSGDLTESQQLHLDYWTAFHAAAALSAWSFRPTKPRPQPWMAFSVGRTNFQLRAYLTTWREDVRRVGCQLAFCGPMGKAHYRAMLVDRPAIDAELGFAPEWRELPDRQESSVNIDDTSADPLDRASWPQQHRWLCEKLDALHRVFAPRIRALVVEASDTSLEEDEG